MANLPESSSFDGGVYQLETTDLVLGGVAGPANAAAQNLANRTRWLFDQNTANVAELSAHAFHLGTIDSEISGINTAIGGINSNLASINGQLPLLAPKANPGFTGVPTAPTAAPGTNNTQIATTAFVQGAVAPLATTAFVQAAINPGASLAPTGYRKNPDGSMEQWGIVIVTSGITVPVDLGISFFPAFIQPPYSVTVAADRRVAQANQAADGSNFASQYTANGATITIDNNGAGQFIGRWRAIGRWA